MTKIGTVFRFAAPDGWTEFRKGNSYVFHGPNREELIVSAYLIQGIGIRKSLAAVQQRLFQNAVHSMKNAAAHPALKVTQPFQQNKNISMVECWSLLAQTQQGGSLFYQTVFRDPLGVLLATLEAPETASAVNAFEQFVKSVRIVTGKEASVE